MKTRARFINAPKETAAGKPAALTGMAQVGMSGLTKVQYCVHSLANDWPADDPYRTKADWKDAAHPAAASELGRRAARGASCRPRARRTGRHAAPMAAALHDCPLGGACSPAWLPAVTTCAAAPSTPTASRSPCRARCRGPVSTPSTWPPWS